MSLDDTLEKEGDNIQTRLNELELITFKFLIARGEAAIDVRAIDFVPSGTVGPGPNRG